MRANHARSRRLALSLTGRVVCAVVLTAALANIAGGAIGWAILVSHDAAQRVLEAEQKARVATAGLRDAYTYVRVDFVAGRVQRIASERPIADTASLLATGLDPVDVLNGIAQVISADVWVLRRDASGAFTAVVTSAPTKAVTGTDGGPRAFAGDAAPFDRLREGTQTGFIDLAGQRHFAALVPLADLAGHVTGAVVVSAGLEADLLQA